MRAAGTVVHRPCPRPGGVHGRPGACHEPGPSRRYQRPLPPAPVQPPTAMQAWCANGYNTWSQVGADVARVHADTGDGDLTALASDGGQLASDARRRAAIRRR